MSIKMINNKFKKIAIASGIAVSLAMPVTANAQFITVTEIVAMGAAMAAELTALMNASSAKIVAIEAATKVHIQASADIEDGVYIAEGDRMIVDKRLKETQRYQLPPAPCLTMRTATGANTVQNQLEANTSKELADLLKRQASTRNGDSNMLRNFSENKMYMAGTATAVNLNADILASSLLMGAGSPGKSKDETFSADQEAAARAFIKNATTSKTLPMLNETQAKTDEGRKYIAMQRAETAAMSLPQFAFSNALAKRMKVKDSNGSPASFLSTEVNRRFANPNWLNEMATKSPEAAAKEDVVLGALNVKLQHERLEVLNRIELLLAQMSINSTLGGKNHTEAMAQYNRAASLSK